MAAGTPIRTRKAAGQTPARPPIPPAARSARRARTGGGEIVDAGRPREASLLVNPQDVIGAPLAGAVDAEAFPDNGNSASPLIRTKLAPPRVGAGRLARERLVGDLDAGRDRRLTLIIGPAGSGKTTLATLWRRSLAERGCDVAWYNVGEDDDESLWAAYLRAALAQCGIDLPPFPSSVREGVEYADMRPYVATLVNALYGHPRPIYLFVDDLQYARQQRVYELLDGLLAHGPDNFHVVIAARSLPPLALTGLRVRDQVTQIDFEQLRFTIDEQTQFLAAQGVSALSEKHARNLQTLTDGWAAGLQLAAYSLRKARSPDDYFSRWNQAPMPAEERSLYGYLNDVVATALTAQQVEALARIAACRRFTEDLCVLVSGDPHAGRVLAALESEGLFVQPIESDDEVQWYRFHKIFAHYLAERLQTLPEAEIKSVHQRAGGWFAERGLFAEAVRHAQFAGDDAALVALVERASRPMICSAHFAQLLGRIDQLPRPLRNTRLELMLSTAWAQLVCRRLGDFHDTVRLIAAHPKAAEPAVVFELSLQRAFDHLESDDTADVPDLLAPYVDAPPTHDGFLLLMIALTGAMGYVCNGRYEAARDLVYDYRQKLDRMRYVRVRPYLDSTVGLSFIQQGDFLQARERLAQLLHGIRQQGRVASDSGSHIAAYLAEVHYHLDDLDAAENYVDECTDTAELFGTVDASVYLGTVQARLHFESGACDAALAALDGMERKAQDEGWDRLAAWSLAERVRIEGRRSRTSMAHEAMRRLRRLAARYSEAQACAWADIPLAAEIAETDLALAEEHWGRAAALAASLSERLSGQQRHYLAARMRIVRALALLGAGDAPAAIEAARPAIADAARFGMNRILRDEGARGNRLLAVLCAAEGFGRDAAQFLRQCAERMSPAGGATREAATPPATAHGAGLDKQEKLTPREREIVQLLGRALSLKSVAKVLNVSVGTVKWHLRNAYGKLDVYSREGAVARARELLIIE